MKKVRATSKKTEKVMKLILMIKKKKKLIRMSLTKNLMRMMKRIM